MSLNLYKNRFNFLNLILKKYIYRPISNILFVARSSIKYRMMFFLIVFSLVPLFILGFVSYSISKAAIDNKVMEYSKQLIKQTGENIDLKLSVYKDFMMTVLSNPDVLKKLKEVNSNSIGQSYVEDLSLTTKLAYFLSVSQEFKTISFISKKHYIKGISRWDEKSEGYVSDFYNKTINSGNNFVWFPTRECYYYENTKPYKENVFSLGKQIFDINDGSSLNMVAIIDIREEVLAEICRKNYSKNLFLESFIIDQKGIIVSHPNKNYLYKNIREYFNSDVADYILNPDVNGSSLEARYDNQDVMVNFIRLGVNDWKVINVINKDTLYKESNKVIRTILVIALLSVFFSVVTAYLIARSISKPLKSMVKVMRQVVAGNLKVRIKGTENKSTHDEIAILQESFNYMISKIEELIKKVLEEQNNKRIAEIKALEAQINPHFLYNTLDTIKWTALFQKANNAAEMASLLSRLLHISLGMGSGETVRVEEEIEHVKCYIGIQKIRFNFNFDVVYNVEEGTKQLRTPKLILQPIVENSILHGLAEKRDGGLITINSFNVEGKLKLEIIDNGCGFDMVDMNTIKKSYRKSGKAFSGIGIANVDERIKLICGQEFGINIESQSGIGTKVGIWLPIME